MSVRFKKPKGTQQHRPSLTVLSSHAFNMDDLSVDELGTAQPPPPSSSSSPSIKVPTTKRKSVFLDDSSDAALSPRTSLRLSSSSITTPPSTTLTPIITNLEAEGVDDEEQEEEENTEAEGSYVGVGDMDDHGSDGRHVIGTPMNVSSDGDSAFFPSNERRQQQRRGSFQSSADFRKEMNLAIDQFPFPPTDPPTSRRQRGSQAKGVLRAFKKRS